MVGRGKGGEVTGWASDPTLLGGCVGLGGVVWVAGEGHVLLLLPKPSPILCVGCVLLFSSVPRAMLLLGTNV